MPGSRASVSRPAPPSTSSSKCDPDHMRDADWKGSLGEAYELAVRYLEDLPERPVTVSATVEQLRAALGGELPGAPTDPLAVVTELAHAAEPGIMPSGSGRYFGFVIGGAPPAAMP